MSDKRKKNVKEKRPSLFTRLSDWITTKKDVSQYPFFIRRRLQSYNTAIAVFLIFGLASWAFTKSLLSVGLGVMLALVTLALKLIQQSEIGKNGFEEWKMEVLEYTYLTSFNRRPTGFYAEAIDGPYEGKVCHVALSSSGLVPPEGRIIKMCVPGNIQANPIRDTYYIPQYYGIELVREH